MSDGGKGSGRRPGQGYQDSWDRIFGKKSCPPCHGNCNQGRNCPARLGPASTASGVLPVAGAEQEHQEQSVPHHPKGGGTLPVREAASAST